ncbi:TPA: hypothetical protein KOR75_001201 [Clostridioides difficile]|nr:hypothetical protein [Clostridioides difficile]
MLKDVVLYCRKVLVYTIILFICMITLFSIIDLSYIIKVMVEDGIKLSINNIVCYTELDCAVIYYVIVSFVMAIMISVCF